MIFELIVVDTPEQAKSYPVKNEPGHVQKAVFIGQSLCGTRHGAMRPNRLTRNHRKLETEKELEWETEILLQQMDQRYRSANKKASL